MRVVMRLQLGIRRLGHRHRKVGLGQPQHREPPPLRDPVVERVGHRLRRRKATTHRALQQLAADVAAQVGLELGLAQTIAVQRHAVGFAVEGSRSALEAVHLHDLGRHDVIADRKPRALRLVVQRGAVDDALDHLLVDPEAQRLLHRKLLADLLRQRADLAPQGAGIVVGADVGAADRADLLHAARETGHAKAAKAEDQHPHQDPDRRLLRLATRAPLVVFGRGLGHDSAFGLFRVR